MRHVYRLLVLILALNSLGYAFVYSFSNISRYYSPAYNTMWDWGGPKVWGLAFFVASGWLFVSVLAMHRRILQWALFFGAFPHFLLAISIIKSSSEGPGPYSLAISLTCVGVVHTMLAGYIAKSR